jgi:tight adherence protein B
VILLPLLVGAVVFALAVFVIERRAAADPGRRVSPYVTPRRITEPTEADQVLLARFERPLAATEEYLRKLPLWPRLETLVERADIRLRAIELFWATTGGVGVLVLLCIALGMSAGVCLTMALLAVIALRLWLGVRIDRRRRAFEEQLPELLGSLGSALRAGHGLNQALQAVAEDAPEPAASEFARVLTEARLGRSLEDSLTDLGARIGSEDFNYVLDAIIVQRQVGGSLAGIFEIVGESVRQRQQFALRIRALTAMGRTSALVLIALPILLALALSVLNHGYLSPLFDTGIGHALLVLAVFLIVVGSAWLHKIVAYKG